LWVSITAEEVEEQTKRASANPFDQKSEFWDIMKNSHSLPLLALSSE
jgi:hypothetical protein